MSTYAVTVQLVMFLLTVLVCLTAPITFVTAVRSLTSVPNAQTALLSTAMLRLSPSSTAIASPAPILTVWSAQEPTLVRLAMVHSSLSHQPLVNV